MNQESMAWSLVTVKRYLKVLSELLFSESILDNIRSRNQVTQCDECIGQIETVDLEGWIQRCLWTKISALPLVTIDRGNLPSPLLVALFSILFVIG